MSCEVTLSKCMCFYDELSNLYHVGKHIGAVRCVFENEQHRVGRGKLVSTVTQSFPFHSFRDADTTAKILILLVAFLQHSLKPTAFFFFLK